MNRIKKWHEYYFPRYRIVRKEYKHKYPMGPITYYLLEERVLLFFYLSFAMANSIKNAEEVVKHQYLKEESNDF